MHPLWFSLCTGPRLLPTAFGFIACPVMYFTWAARVFVADRRKYRVHFLLFNFQVEALAMVQH
jgi:hypothetical protein